MQPLSTGPSRPSPPLLCWVSNCEHSVRISLCGMGKEGGGGGGELSLSITYSEMVHCHHTVISYLGQKIMICKAAQV